MKKRITVFVVLIMAMVLCLALTGCGQNTNKQDATTNDSHPGENFDTGDSSIMDGTNNPGGIIQSDDDSYADDAAKDREDTSVNDNANSTANKNADGTYSWQIGGSTITTKINVMDYIDGNVWHVNDMATALGWDKNKRADSPKPMTFQPDDTYDVYINFSDGGDHCNAIIIKGNNRSPISLALPPRTSGDYTFNTQDYTMSFEGIVVFAYTCEYLTDNHTGNPFDGVLSGSGDSYSY